MNILEDLIPGSSRWNGDRATESTELTCMEHIESKSETRQREYRACTVNRKKRQICNYPSGKKVTTGVTDKIKNVFNLFINRTGRAGWMHFLFVFTVFLIDIFYLVIFLSLRSVLGPLSFPSFRFVLHLFFASQIYSCLSDFALLDPDSFVFVNKIRFVL